MSAISDIFAREVLDSRGEAAVEVDVLLAGGAFGRAQVPSEAEGPVGGRPGRDGGEAPDRRNWAGLSAGSINEVIGPGIKGLEADEQGELDRALVALGGTPDMTGLGSGALFGVSTAVVRAAAVDHRMPLYQYLGGVAANVLPVPMVNLATLVDDGPGTVFREAMVFPVGASSLAEAIRMSADVYHAFGRSTGAAGEWHGVAHDGSFITGMPAEKVLQTIARAITECGYSPGGKVWLALGAGAAGLYSEGAYDLGGGKLGPDGLVDAYEGIVDRFPVASIEDPVAPGDLEGWKLVTARIGGRVQIVVGNPPGPAAGAVPGPADAVLLRPDRAGTITRALELVSNARRAGCSTVIAGRTGETEDSTLADLAVAVGAGQVKAGAPHGGERVCRYNQLLRIEENLCEDATFPGRSVLPVGLPRDGGEVSGG